MQTDRPLFIPLRLEHFEAFERGDKRSELRAYGRRWNERTCPVGRAVTLSCGYGRARRLHGRIWQFNRRRGDTFGRTYRAAIMSVYGTLEIEIAEIRIELASDSEVLTIPHALRRGDD